MNDQFRFQMPATLRNAGFVLLLVGVVGCALGAVLSPDALAVHLLLVANFGVSLGLAGAVFVALQYVSGAAWSVPLRRVPEAMVALLPISGALLLVTLVAFPLLYPWTDHELHLHGQLKHAWLQRPFFLIRALAYLLLWTLPALALVRASRSQDTDGSFRHTVANRRWSALFLVLFGGTFWLASYDWLMSREPNWSSTVYGLYNFAGLFTSGWAVLILVALWLHHLGPYREVLTESRLHDLGKLLFGMCVFWAYLWYCQYMLIWFVNNPEETPYYIQRLDGFWATLFYVNVALNGVIPFLVLLPRAMKKSPKPLIVLCSLLLVGRWLDLYLMIYPEDHGVVDDVIGMLVAVGAVGLFVLVLCWSLARAALIPQRDPYLAETVPAHGHVPRIPAGIAGGRP